MALLSSAIAAAGRKAPAKRAIMAYDMVSSKKSEPAEPGAAIDAS